MSVLQTFYESSWLLVSIQLRCDKQEVVWQSSLPFFLYSYVAAEMNKWNWFVTVKPAASIKANLSSGLFHKTATQLSAMFVMMSGCLSPLLLAERCQWSVSPSSLSSCLLLPGAFLPPAPPPSPGLYLKHTEVWLGQKSNHTSRATVEIQRRRNIRNTVCQRGCISVRHWSKRLLSFL